jgi:hypothetical protein
MLYNIINTLKNVLSGQKNDDLDIRMRDIVNSKNSLKCHGFKPFVITLKSKTLMSYINRLTDYDSKIKELNEFQDILFKVSKKIYTKYDPHLIYTFQNEINVVFYYNDDGNYIYDGNINKMITSMSSYVTMEFTKQLLKRNIDIDVYFFSQFVEFDIDYEILNYLVWRQMDCKRNTITLLYKCMYKDEFLDGTRCVENVSVTKMIELISDKVRDNNNLLIGNTIKKFLFYKIVKGKFDKKNVDNSDNVDGDIMVSRKSVGIETVIFSENFKENLQKYVMNKVY